MNQQGSRFPLKNSTNCWEAEVLLCISIVRIQLMNEVWATKSRQEGKLSAETREKFLQTTGLPEKSHFPYQPCPSHSWSQSVCPGVNWTFFWKVLSFSILWEVGRGERCKFAVLLLIFWWNTFNSYSSCVTPAKTNPVNTCADFLQGWGGISLPALMPCCILQVMDCAMPLIGEHQTEDRQHITELVVSKMNQMLSKTPIPSPQRPTATQQPQVG